MVELALDPEEDLLFLKNCVIKNTDQNVIVVKLYTTRALRREMTGTTEFHLRESFPFFLAEPQLVIQPFYFFSFEYSNLFLNVCLDLT